MSTSIPAGLPTIVYVWLGLVVVLSAIISIIPALINARHINKVDLSNQDALEALLEKSPTIVSLRRHDDSDLDKLKSMEHNLAYMESMIHESTSLTLQQCMYSTVNSREKHEFVIRQCKKYLSLPRNGDDVHARVHYENLIADYKRRDKNGDWSYGCKTPEVTIVGNDSN